ncbi:Cbf1p SCDLUD_000427 [Saccharomycodes ludwigii]|uniref:Cbf1p n=1 Tax=Saccharomycodes ludwigii TaxID=36035 RepID=UPI001E82C53F|nr:hypothetical protein SCDLUD_000427 [Saccharomycodes ludwigii]KAH3902835.1 hypothetical protein SCDLUD_000427 [Saccharomycodes ludwigii]
MTVTKRSIGGTNIDNINNNKRPKNQNISNLHNHSSLLSAQEENNIDDTNTNIIDDATTKNETQDAKVQDKNIDSQLLANKDKSNSIINDQATKYAGDSNDATEKQNGTMTSSVVEVATSATLSKQQSQEEEIERENTETNLKKGSLSTKSADIDNKNKNDSDVSAADDDASSSSSSSSSSDKSSSNKNEKLIENGEENQSEDIKQNIDYANLIESQEVDNHTEPIAPVKPNNHFQIEVQKEKQLQNRQRKESHKEVERRRRENINTAIGRVARLLPFKESSKAAILNKAAEYIEYLQKKDGEMNEQLSFNKVLDEQEIQRLSTANESLKEALAQAYVDIKNLEKQLTEKANGENEKSK